MFITLEGVEGSGKTSHIAPLVKYFSGLGYDVLATREPGGTSIGDRIREVLLDLDNTTMHPRTEILLFQASRAQLVEELIKPHLAKGGVVLCDRYADSTIAYQGFGYQLDLELIKTVVNYATDQLVPDLTLLLDVEVELGLQRRAGGGQWNRLDAYNQAFYQRVRQGFLHLAASEPERWVIVDASQPLDHVQAQLQDIVLERLEVTHKL